MNRVPDERYVRRLVEHAVVGVCGVALLGIGGGLALWPAYVIGLFLCFLVMVTLGTDLFLWQPQHTRQIFARHRNNWIWHANRERDDMTRAISLVVSRGFGLHVRLTLWWFAVSVHRRDCELERLLSAKVAELESSSQSRLT